MKSLTVLGTLVFVLAITQTRGLFFGTPRNQCTSNSQCRSFNRSRCDQPNFLLFCFGNARQTLVGGRCLNKNNVFCSVGSLLQGNTRNRGCNYRECAQCLENQDCRFDERCSGGTCYESNRTGGGNRIEISG